MKLLLDEQLPRRLAHRLVPLHDALTVQDMDWRGKKNGELLKLLIEHEFAAFITVDKKMRYEQNWRNYTIPVIFLDVPNLKYGTVKQLVPQVLALLAQPGRAMYMWYQPSNSLIQSIPRSRVKLLSDLISLTSTPLESLVMPITACNTSY